LSLNIYMENKQLTIADLASIQSLLDTACARGTFKGSEMRMVGDIYDKLAAFLEAAKQTAQATEQNPTQGE
jgi:hypothetical protein